MSEQCTFQPRFPTNGSKCTGRSGIQCSEDFNKIIVATQIAIVQILSFTKDKKIPFFPT